MTPSMRVGETENTLERYDRITYYLTERVGRNVDEGKQVRTCIPDIAIGLYAKVIPDVEKIVEMARDEAALAQRIGGCVDILQGINASIEEILGAMIDTPTIAEPYWQRVSPLTEHLELLMTDMQNILYPNI